MENNEEIGRLVEDFLTRRYLCDMGKNKLAKYLKTSVENILIAKKIARMGSLRENVKETNVPIDYSKKFSEKKTNYQVSVHKNVLVIGDTHLPYEKEGYLDFCIEQYDKWKIGRAHV